MVSHVSPTVLKDWLHDGGEIALLDVREHGQFGEHLHEVLQQRLNAVRAENFEGDQPAKR